MSAATGPVAPASRRWRNKALPIAGALSLLTLWQGVITGFSVPQYIAPSPWDVIQAFHNDSTILWNNFWPTLMEALAGFVCGNLVAVLIAVAFVHSKSLEKAFYPTAVFINTIPIIAIAPILVLIFGNGYTPKIVIAGLICFFPTLVNMVRGLEAVSPASLDLMRILSANRWDVFWRLRIQSSLPFLFAALKIASTTCVIGAIVGEWIGSDFGLGALIIDATYNFRSPLLYATVLLAAGLAITLFSLTSFAERRLVKWKPGAVH